VQQRAGEYVDPAIAFGCWDELVGRDPTDLRMAPSGEKLEAPQLAGAQLDQGLEVGTELPVGDRMAYVKSAICHRRTFLFGDKFQIWRLFGAIAACGKDGPGSGSLIPKLLHTINPEIVLRWELIGRVPDLGLLGGDSGWEKSVRPGAEAPFEVGWKQGPEGPFFLR